MQCHFFSLFHIRSYFCRFTDKNATVSAIGKVGYKGGEFSSLGLISGGMLLKDIFSFNLGDRLFVPSIAVGVTDGLPRFADEELAAFSGVFQKIGVKPFVVCVTPGCTESLAKGVAAEPKQVRYAMNINCQPVLLVRKKSMCTN